MINRFKKHINDQLLFNKEDSIILSISGGADSVCLALILKELNFNFSLAHCNFNLRGLESDTDEGFVRELADKMNLNVHVMPKLCVSKCGSYEGHFHLPWFGSGSLQKSG